MSVYVSNINWDTTQDHLQKYFSRFGTVKHVNLKENKVRRAPGYAFIEFLDQDSVTKAIECANGDGVSGCTDMTRVVSILRHFGPSLTIVCVWSTD